MQNWRGHSLSMSSHQFLIIFDKRKGCVFIVDYLCDMVAFSMSIFAHVYIGFNISEPPGRYTHFYNHIDIIMDSEILWGHIINYGRGGLKF